MKTFKTELGDYTGFKGDIFAAGKGLESLEGSPRIVVGYFYCSSNKLKSLEGGPEYVGTNFYCFDNPNLESLRGAPQYVDGYFNCAKELRKGENLYIIINALLNGSRDKRQYPDRMLEVLKEYLT